MKKKPIKLTERFFSRASKTVAESLIGTTLVVDGKRGKKEAVILGTKAFEGGNTTKYREGMNYPASTIFLMSFRGHTFLNFSTERGNKPSCVMVDKILLREGDKETLIEGPGKVARNLGVNKHWDGLLLGKKIWIENSTNKKSTQKRIQDYSENCIASFEAA